MADQEVQRWVTIRGHRVPIRAPKGRQPAARRRERAWFDYVTEPHYALMVDQEIEGAVRQTLKLDKDPEVRDLVQAGLRAWRQGRLQDAAESFERAAGLTTSDEARTALDAVVEELNRMLGTAWAGIAEQHRSA